MTDSKKEYDLIISKHARERWLERIVDPNHYNHLSSCKEKGCPKCMNLINDLNWVIQTNAKHFDREIVKTFRIARDENIRVTDINFMEAMTKEHNIILQNIIYYKFQNIVFMVDISKNIPILVTVMTSDMIEGTVFRKLNSTELKPVFNRWKFDARQRKDKEY